MGNILRPPFTIAGSFLERILFEEPFLCTGIILPFVSV
jgi:hypothetical protein